VQQLIDDCLKLTDDETMDHQVDLGNLGMIMDKDEVAFFNLLDSEKESEDFVWAMTDFITFLEDFKIFIEENS